MKILFRKSWAKNALLAFVFLLSVSATIIMMNSFELSYDKEIVSSKPYETKSSSNDNYIPFEVKIKTRRDPNYNIPEYV